MEITNTAVQTVGVNQNVLFSETVIPGGCGCSSSIVHRAGSGLVTLRGLSCSQCRARFKATFGGNIQVPEGETNQSISLTMALNGEPVPSTAMIQTPPGVSQFMNVSSSIYIDVPKGCCVTLSVENTSPIAINVQNANFIIERVA